VVSGITSGSTNLTFSTILFTSLFCSGSDAALCGAGFATGTATVSGPADSDLVSGTSDTFTLGSLTFTTNAAAPWQVVDLGGGFFGVHLLGDFDDGPGGLDATPGFLDYSFQNVQAGVSNFSASGGTTIPEPGSMVLLSAGLTGLAIFARRRKIQR
jgi:hypothetical protein